MTLPGSSLEPRTRRSLSRQPEQSKAGTRYKSCIPKRNTSLPRPVQRDMFVCVCVCVTLPIEGSRHSPLQLKCSSSSEAGNAAPGTGPGSTLLHLIPGKNAALLGIRRRETGRAGMFPPRVDNSEHNVDGVTLKGQHSHSAKSGCVHRHRLWFVSYLVILNPLMQPLTFYFL